MVRRAMAASADAPITYPSNAVRRILTVVTALIFTGLVLGSIRYGIYGVTGRPLAWSDINIPISVGASGGALLGAVNGVSFRASNRRIVVRLLLRRTEFGWTDIAGLDKLNPAGGKITLYNAREVSVNWSAAQLIRLTAPRHNLYDTFVGSWEQGTHTHRSAYSRRVDWIPIIITIASTLSCTAVFLISRIVVLNNA